VPKEKSQTQKAMVIDVTDDEDDDNTADNEKGSEASNAELG